MTKTVAVDFDGVIHAYSKGWSDGSIYDEAIPGAFDAIRGLMEAGWAVYIHTTREPMSVAHWIMKQGRIHTTVKEPTPEFWNETERLLVTNKKLPAVAYIDDRGIRFANWEQAIADLHELEG